MSIRIPIVTVFDSKGLRAAEYQLRKVSQNFNNLGRNFAIAGAAFGGIAVGLGKSVKVASDLGESINAVNVSFGKSAKGILDFGKTASTTLGLSAVDFNNAAVRFSAFADRIVGSGGDASGFIREITTRAADFASVFNIEVSEALQVFQSGLAGEAEPLKRFGINLLDSEVRAYAAANGIGQLGKELTETEKVQARYGLLLQSTNKTAGDFANTSDGLANGMRILKAELTNAQAEIGQALLPAIQELIPIVRDLSAEFGTKLKAAVEAVDWRSVITLVGNLLTFFVQHIETIVKVVATLWTLNTVYNAIKVTVGLYNAAAAILNVTLAATGTAATTASVGVRLLNAALSAGILGAVIGTIALIAEGFRAVATDARLASGEVTKLYNKTKAELIAEPWRQAANPAKVYVGLIRDANEVKFNSHQVSINQIERAWENAKKAAERYAGSAAGQGVNTSTLAGVMAISRGVNPFDQNVKPDLKIDGSPQPSSAPRETFGQVVQRNVTAQIRQTKLMAKGLSEGAAQLALSTVNNKKQFQKLQATLSKPGVAAKRQAQFNRTAAGIAELAAIQQAQDAADQAAEASRQAAIRAAEEAAAREAAILAEKQRIYQSFANSVISTFSRIQESILSAFSLPSLGGSTDSIIRNMDKLLARVKSFSANITKLSSMGLDPKLLQQVINAGPIAGAKLAANLVAGGVGGLAAINRGYSELSTVAGEIGMTGTQAQFQTAQQQQIININIEGGLDSSAAIGKAVVDAVRAYERTSGAVWQGA